MLLEQPASNLADLDVRKLIPSQTAPTPTRISDRPECRLLFACARTTLDSEIEQRIKGILEEVTDWDYALRKAQQNYILPLVCWNLLRVSPDQLPVLVKDQLQKYFHNHAQHNLFLTARLLKILSTLSLYEIPCLPLKGPTLAETAYGNLSLRMFGDLDILVAKHDVLKTAELLAELGFALHEGEAGLAKALSKGNEQKDVGMVSQDGRVRIELHWRLSRSYFAFALDSKRNMKNLWEQLETTTIAGVSVRALPVDDLLIYLCQHGTKHKWKRLEWVSDIAELVRSQPEIDWKRLMKRASALGCERVLTLGLFLAHDLLGAALPEPFRRMISANQLYRSVANDTRELLFIEPDTTSNIFEKHHFRLLLKERWRDKAQLLITYSRMYLHMALTPKEADRVLLPLPANLSFIHYLSRPARLIIKYPVLALRKLLGKR